MVSVFRALAGSEPGLLAVGKVGAAEFCAQDEVFAADAPHQSEDGDDEIGVEINGAESESDAGEAEHSEEVNGMANPGIKPVADEGTGFGLGRERCAELQAGEQCKGEARQSEGGAEEGDAIGAADQGEDEEGEKDGEIGEEKGSAFEAVGHEVRFFSFPSGEAALPVPGSNSKKNSLNH